MSNAEELKQRYAAALHRAIDNTLGTEQSNDEPVAWKTYEEVHFSDQYILRWVREGDEYVNRITREMMEDFKAIVRQQQAEIEALKQTNLRFADLITEQRKLINEEIYNKAGIK